MDLVKLHNPNDFLKSTWGESFHIFHNDTIGHLALMHAWDKSIVIWQLEIYEKYRRAGFGLKVLKYLQKRYPVILRAAVNIKNTASIKLFLKAGFIGRYKVTHNNEEQIWYEYKPEIKDNQQAQIDELDENKYYNYDFPPIVRKLNEVIRFINKASETTKGQPNNTECYFKGGKCFCNSPEKAACKG